MEPYWLFWNIPRPLEGAFYVAAFLALLLFGLGMGWRTSLWMRGTDEPRTPLYGRGRLGILWLSLVKLFSPDCLLARRVFPRSRARAVALIFSAWGFTALVVLLALSFAAYYGHLYLLRGRSYWLFSLLSDLAGFMLLAGVSFAVARRYVFRLEPLVNASEDGWALVILFSLAFSGFLVEGLRLAITGAITVEYAPFGGLFASAVTAVFPGGTLLWAHRLAWSLHVASALALVAYLPYSKLVHLFAAQLVTHAAAQRGREARSEGETLYR